MFKINFMLKQHSAQEALPEVPEPQDNAKKGKCHECKRLFHGRGSSKNQGRVKYCTKRYKVCHNFTCHSHLTHICVKCDDIASKN